MTVQDDLNALGTTAGEVAASLTKAGVKGRPGNPCSCPVANYLRSCCGFELVSIGAMQTIAEVNGNGVRCATPWSVGRFIQMFDRDSFSDLLE